MYIKGLGEGKRKRVADRVPMDMAIWWKASYSRALLAIPLVHTVSLSWSLHAIQRIVLRKSHFSILKSRLGIYERRGQY